MSILKRIVYGALILNLLVACADNSAHVNFQNDAFSMKNLKAGRLTLVMPVKVEVTEFKKSFENLFQTQDSCLSYMARVISDSMRSMEKHGHGIPATLTYSDAFDHDRNDERMFEETLDPKYAQATDTVFRTSDSKYVLTLKNVAIGETNTSSPGMVTGSTPGGGLTMAGSSSSERCLVSFDVDIWDKTRKRKMASVSFSGSCKVVLFAYETALQVAMGDCLRHFVTFLKSGSA
ncbi:MAG: hypothetical protein JWO30_1836 [Fibrobacteres bacterium]|nr:hypothetical protein [Fibrobacterota bacterium]